MQKYEILAAPQNKNQVLVFLYVANLFFGNYYYKKIPIVPTNNTIIENLDRFIRKYYKSRLIKGALYAVGALVVLYLAMVVIEHFGYFGTAVRTLFFWLYLAALVAILAVYVVRPLLKMNKLGKRISYDEAAQIVGRHFPEIKDKLLNLLQLQRQQASNAESDNSLLLAAIEQKTAQISPIPFTNAVDLKVNRRYVKYAAIPLLAVIVLALVSPSFISEPSKRIINHTTEYERPAPFAFEIENAVLEASQQEDFALQVKIVGDAVPNEAFIDIDGRQYKMQAVDKTHFTYTFKNLQRSHQFRFTAAGVESKSYQLSVFPRPSVIHFQASMAYPAYTGKANEVLANEGDFTVPQGTTISWVFQTKDVDTLVFLTDEGRRALTPNDNGRVTLSIRAVNSFDYAFFVMNGKVPTTDTLRYSVSTIADMVPMIAVMEMRDSLTPNRIFFRGRIKDDYGFSKLEFRLQRINESDTSLNRVVVTPVGITKDNSQEFNFSTNLNEIGINPGDHIKYHFTVWDNDAIHGPKSATSQEFEINIPSQKELDNLLEKNLNDIENKANTSMSELKKLQKEIDETMRKLIDKKDLNYQDKKQLQDLINKHNEVKNMLEKMQQQINENNRLEENYRKQDEQILEKQKELNELFDKVMNEEMKDLMKQLDELMKDTDKQKVQEQLENLKLKNEDIEKQLDQNIELMKRLEMEKRVDETAQRIDKLAEKQKELSKQTEQSKGKDKENLMQQQQQLNKEFQDLKKEIEQIKKDYKEIDPSLDLKTDKELEQRIQNEQNQAQQNLQKGKNKEASSLQKQAADDMEKMSQDLQDAQSEMEQQDLAEDSEMVRRLLKNVVRLSFNQEELINQINAVSIQDPRYQHIINEQNKLRTDFRNVEDSLRAMAKRQLMVAATINKELSAVNTNTQKSLSSLLQYNQSIYGNWRNTSAAQFMQYSMTALNNLALVMAESLDKMQDQQRQQQQKKSCKNPNKNRSNNQCSNPGQSKPSPKSMKQMQEELNKQLEALKKQLDKNGKPQGRPTLDKQQQSMSKEFAEAAARQEAIRRLMQQYGQELKQQSGGNSKLAKEVEDMMRQMEQTETDLVNKTITQQTLRRQQQITTRLLEHEKAEMQREKEERRQSTEGKDIYQPTQSDLERYKRLQEKNMELFRTVPPSLTPYYKNKVNEYFFDL